MKDFLYTVKRFEGILGLLYIKLKWTSGSDIRCKIQFKKGSLQSIS